MQWLEGEQEDNLLWEINGILQEQCEQSTKP